MSYVRAGAWRDAKEESRIDNPEKINGILSQLRLESEARKKNASQVGATDVALRNFINMSLTGLAKRKLGKSFDDAPISKEEFETSPFYHKDIPYEEGMTMKQAEYNYDSMRKRKQVEDWYKENPIFKQENVFGGSSIQYSNIPKRLGEFALMGAGFATEITGLGLILGSVGAGAAALGAARLGAGIAGAGELLGGSAISKQITQSIGKGLFGNVVGRGAEGLIQNAAYETLAKKAGLTNELIKEGDVTAKERELRDIGQAGLTGLGFGSALPIIGKGLKLGKGLLYKSKNPSDKLIDFSKGELISNEIRNGVKAELDTLPLKTNEVQTPSGRVTMPEKLFSDELGHDIVFNYKVVDLADIKVDKLAKAEDPSFVLNGMFSRESSNTFKKGAMLLDVENNLHIGKRRHATLSKMFEEGGDALDKYIANLQNTGHDISKMERPVLVRVLETPLNPEEISKLSLLSHDVAPKVFDPISNKTESQLLFPNSISSAGLGRDVKVVYKIVELDSLKASHKIGTKKLDKNPLYNQDLQPRDRERAASYDQITKMADNFDARKMIVSTDDAIGMPIIDKDLNVLSGNGRKIILDQLDINNNYNQYIDALEQYGLDTTGFNRPVAVRMLDETLENDKLMQFVHGANETNIARMSETEQAISDAKTLINNFTDKKDLTKILKEKLPKNDLGDFIDANGNLSVAGNRRIEAALLHKAFDDNKLTSLLFENLEDQDLLTLRGFLKDISPAIVRLKNNIEKGHVDKIADISGNIKDAFYEIKYSLDYHGNTLGVGADLAQKDMFNPINPLTETITRSLFENEAFARKLLPQSRTTAFFNDVISKIENEITTNDFFGTKYTERDIGSIIDNIKTNAEKENFIKYSDIADKTQNYIDGLKYDLDDVNNRIKNGTQIPTDVKPRPEIFDKYNQKIDELKNGADIQQIEAMEKIQKNLKDSVTLQETMKSYADCILGKK